MCKVLMIAGIDNAHRDNAIKFTKKMAELMTPGNDDGLGYAAVDAEGNLFSERWLKNTEAFKTKGTPQLDIKVLKYFKPYAKYKDVEVEYSTHGAVDLNKMVAITLHTRAATGPVRQENVHPFITEDTSVIHNGVIVNDDDFKLTLSTCDSESILVSYLKNGVGKNMKGIDKLASELIGYYACGTFSRDERGNRVMDVYKANNDNLSVAFIDELNTWVMSSWGYNIVDACKQLGFKCGNYLDIKDGVLLRFDPVSGETIASEEFKVSDRNKVVRSIYPTNHLVKEEPLPMHRPKGLSKEKIEYLKQPSDIRKLSYTEAFEYMEASGYWS
jgi:predicted glutamine amidotransferase